MGTTATLYFPPTGFGFWYYLGQYSQYLKTRNNSDTVGHCYGASSGSLLCLCTLIRDEYKDNLFDVVSELAIESRDEIQSSIGPPSEQVVSWNSVRNLIPVPNLYSVVKLFVDKLIPYTTLSDQTLSDLSPTASDRSESNNETDEVMLSRIHIVLTRLMWDWPAWFRLGLRREIRTPISTSECRHLILASTYIPILSNCENLPYYSIEGNDYVDGGLMEWYAEPMFQPANSDVSIRMPTHVDHIRKEFIRGQSEPLSIVRNGHSGLLFVGDERTYDAIGTLSVAIVVVVVMAPVVVHRMFQYRKHPMRHRDASSAPESGMNMGENRLAEKH
jgi:hypothetical protein